MEGISDIRITGIDEQRPPFVRKEPYIDIFFKLSHQAPSEWCKDFNNIMANYPTAPKIKEAEGLYIDSWVRKPEEIADLLNELQKTVKECSRLYIERIEIAKREALASNAKQGQQDQGEQGVLNRILAGLDFDVP